jgi:hypothetical protein
VRISIIVAVAVLVGLSACSKTETTTGAPKSAVFNKVPIDISTPDNALRSYWAVIDSINLQRGELDNQRDILNAVKETVSQLRSVSDEKVYKTKIDNSRLLEIFSRDITEVKIESDSRAIIFVSIKNITPLPLGVALLKHEEEWRREGSRFRYTMGGDKSGWRVTEIFEWQEYLSPDNWKKISPDDGRPYMPSLASYGY